MIYSRDMFILFVESFFEVHAYCWTALCFHSEILPFIFFKPFVIGRYLFIIGILLFVFVLLCFVFILSLRCCFLCYHCICCYDCCCCPCFGCCLLCCHCCCFPCYVCCFKSSNKWTILIYIYITFFTNIVDLKNKPYEFKAQCNQRMASFKDLMKMQFAK